MSLSSALSIAMAGLRANQAALSIVSSNIANAQTSGYVTQSSTQVEVTSGGNGSSVRVIGVNRQLDEFIQTQLRTETSGGAYAGQIANVLNQLQSLYGIPGEAGTLENAFSNFTSALQSLSASAGNASAQVSVLTAAQSFAQQLNATTTGIQALRSNAEQNIANSASTANAAMSQIAAINARLQGFSRTDPAAATLMNQRDSAITKLSELLDVRVVIDSTNQTTIYTNSGMPLVSGQTTSQFTFSGQGTLTAKTEWNADPAKSGVGALMLVLPDGSKIDMIATRSITSGKIAADLKLRDETLVQAQTQVDQLAASLAASLSDTTAAGIPATSGPQTGFDVDLANVLPGNSINLTYTETATNTLYRVTIVRVDDPAALPLSNTGAPANTRTIGINFSGGMASVAAQLNTALGSAGLSFGNPSGSILRVLDTVAAAATVNAASTTTTATALASGNPQLAVFTDGKSAYTGAITATGSQMTGFGGRIAVNAALLADPTLLSVYNTSPVTTAGDATRSDYLYSQLTNGNFTYSAKTGLGSAASPFRATLTSYMQQFLSLQSNAATAATQLKQGQDVVVSTLQSKFNSTAGVSIDTEMSNLIALQNTYAANARVMSVVQTMMTGLLQSIN